MADVTDVSAAIVDLLASTLIPTATDPTVLVPSVVQNIPLRIYQGWPEVQSLQADIKTGVNISVYITPRVGRLTTRYQETWDTVSSSPLTVSMSVVGNTVTISGSGTAGNAIGIALGSQAYTHRPQAGESPTVMAQALQALIPGSSLSGSTITLPSTPLVATGSDTVMSKEVRRQIQQFVITTWAGSPSARDAIGAAVSNTMAQCRSLVFHDGSCSEIPMWRNTDMPQMDERTGVYRRQEAYDIQYPTVVTMTAPAVLFAGLTVNSTVLSFAGSEG